MGDSVTSKTRECEQCVLTLFKIKMPRDFKYDVVQLIQCVKDRPCLWDKTLEIYKDRVERQTAWEEICCHLDENYEQMTREEKRTTGEVIQNKWRNIRDTFVKTLKTEMGKPKKKYLLYDHVKFLTKVIGEEERTIDFPVETDDGFFKVEIESEGEVSYKPRMRTRHKTDYDESPPKKKKSDYVVNNYESYATDNIDFVAVDETDPRIRNEDEAFFASLLPSVVRYNEDERLEFRIQVLAVMKKIKEKRSWVVDE